jgi:hypothetical protein
MYLLPFLIVFGYERRKIYAGSLGGWHWWGTQVSHGKILSVLSMVFLKIKIQDLTLDYRNGQKSRQKWST